MNKTAGKIIIDGNAAAALGAMFAGCTVVALVSDHPVFQPSGIDDRLHEQIPERQGNREEYLRHRAGRG